MMNKTLKIKIEEGEYWYGGLIDDTQYMPFSTSSNVRLDMIDNYSYNQNNPMLISSNGRYVYAEEFFILQVADGWINLESPADMDYGEKGSFREAYDYLKDTYFPFDGKYPLESLFTKPQYCTWMALGENLNQDSVLQFAENILKVGLPAGELIFDDGWTDYVGQFEFAVSKFPDPKGMCDKLQEMGFILSVWMTPYVSSDSSTFRDLSKKGYLVKKNGEPFIAHWWQGYSACIDFTNPAARDWVAGRIKSLQDRYGIVGVKMDGGDARIYESGLETYGQEGATANGLAEAYGRFAANYSVSEIRSTAKCGGLPIMQRIADRYHAWSDEKNGFDGIVKKALIMSVSGYPYNCPDMVGGGQYEDIDNQCSEDEELNIRYMQAATFMPSIQFSKRLWEHTEKTKQVVLKMLSIREQYANYILELVKNCAETGEPIIRSMLYAYGVLPANNEQFMLGERLLVAPVLAKDARTKRVWLPQGAWKYEPTGELFNGDQTLEVEAPLETLPYFSRYEEE